MGGFDHVVMKQVTKQVNLKNVGLYVLHRSYVISEPASYADIRWARHAICVTSPKNVCLRPTFSTLYTWMNWPSKGTKSSAFF